MDYGTESSGQNFVHTCLGTTERSELPVVPLQFTVLGYKRRTFYRLFTICTYDGILNEYPYLLPVLSFFYPVIVLYTVPFPRVNLKR